MKKLLVASFILLVSILPSKGRSDDGPKNCKLTIRTKFKSGKRKVDIQEVHAATREECKLIAKEKEQTTDEDVEKITATYGFR